MTWTGMLLGFLAVLIVARWLLIGGEKARS
jgi:hypothetical protein